MIKPNMKITKLALLTFTFIFIFIFLISNVNSTVDPYEFLHIVPNPDGTLYRPPKYWPVVPASTRDSASPSVSRDVVLNSEKNTWVRIYLPRSRLDTPELGGAARAMSGDKLPIFMFVHGGGFIVASVGTPGVNEFCTNASSILDALVISVEYRLAPEHRLPAAYDDVFEALSWVKEGKDEWVSKYGDFSRCVLMGESSGGNTVYNIGLKAAVRIEDFKPLVIVGLVLIQPFFGGVERTESELRLVNDSSLPLVVNDLMWNLSLPVGSKRDIEYCNPFTGGVSNLLDRVRELGWWVGLLGCDGDPLFDRQVRLGELMKEKGVKLKSLFDKGGHHGIFTTNPSKVKELIGLITDLLHGQATEKVMYL